MQHGEKIGICYGRRVFAVPSSVLPKLKNAKKNDIIILLEFLASPDAEIDDIAASCGADAQTVESALSFWRGAGILTLDDDAAPSAAPEAAAEPVSEKKKRERTLEAVPSYTSEEIAAIVSSDKSVSDMIDECQQILGKIFGQTDTVRLVSVMNYYNVNPEYILLVAAHCVGMGKKSVAYLVSTVAGLYSSGICDADTLGEYLMAIARSATLETKVRALFGIGMQRALSDREKDFISTWSEKYGYEIEIITIAFNITVDTTGNASMPYANAILQKWFEAGLRKPEEIEEYLANEKKQKNGDKSGKKNQKNDVFGGKSFDSEAFFNASLLRSYGSDLAVPKNALAGIAGNNADIRNVGPVVPPEKK